MARNVAPAGARSVTIGPLKRSRPDGTEVAIMAYAEWGGGLAIPQATFSGDDAYARLIHHVFVYSWARHSGHSMPDKPQGTWTNEELVDFWADDDVVWL
jgi:hypothetical protein